MGAPAQPNQPTQVYYDPKTSQYFSYGKAENSNGLANLLMGMGLPITTVNGQPVSREKMYLNNPFINQNRFKTNTQATPYAELTNLFPSLNTSSVQGLMSPTQTDGAMSGAGRFLSPQTNNTQGK